MKWKANKIKGSESSLFRKYTCIIYIYIYTLVLKKVDISKMYISFVSLGKQKVYIFIYISEMSTFL